MTWTYAPPVDGQWPTLRDRARFLVGDTTENEYSLLDAEVDALEALLQDEYGTVDGFLLAAEIAESLAARYETAANTLSKVVGNSSLTKGWFTSRSAGYRKLAERFRGRTTVGTMSGMGLSRAAAATPATFRMRQFDAPGGYR